MKTIRLSDKTYKNLLGFIEGPTEEDVDEAISFCIGSTRRLIAERMGVSIEKYCSIVGVEWK